MRRLGRLLLVLPLVALVLFALVHLLQAWQRWRVVHPPGTDGLEERVLFEALRGSPLRFNVAVNEGWFALQGFAVASRDARREPLPLAVEVTILGEGGRPLHREARYLELRATASASPYGLLEGLEERPVWILPTEWIELASWPGARSVAVRVIEQPASIDTVLWRGAIDNRLSDAQAQLRYRRLGTARREELTRDWVTPGSLIAPEAKTELVRYRQDRVAPVGRAGEAFRARRVLRTPAAPSRRTDSVRQAALAVAPGLRASFRLDTAAPVLIDPRRPGGRPLEVALLGRTPSGQQVRATLPGPWAGQLPEGTYELRTAGRGDVEVREAGSGDQLLPDGVRVRGFLATEAHPLVYSLAAVGPRLPPMRLQLRPASPGPAVVAIAYLDGAGRVLRTVAERVEWRASVNDRRADALDRAASEPVVLELDPPPGARRMAITSTGPVLATAFTGLAAAAGDTRGTARRRWFSFLPEPGARGADAQGIVVIQQPTLDRPATRPAPARGARSAQASPVPRASARAAQDTPSPRARRPGSADADRAKPERASRPQLRLRPERATEAED